MYLIAIRYNSKNSNFPTIMHMRTRTCPLIGAELNTLSTSMRIYDANEAISLLKNVHVIA